MLSDSFSIASFIFLIYGLLSPIYSRFLRNKVSNETLFLVAWSLAPHLVALFYSSSLLVVLLVLLSLGINLFVVYKRKFRIIYSGATFLFMAIIIQIFINPFSGLYN
ncbi:hypothetical protein V6M85_00445 [Sulfolobus tengchongensis]|uniref:Uncharacterized protein n=1 Tax=Sulfolobus tengchongensis TaxID=207809 RepID=A0AAX4L1C7_9CREN